MDTNFPPPEVRPLLDIQDPPGGIPFVVTAPYNVPVNLNAVLGPAINDYLDVNLPILLPPYIDPAAEAAVQALALLRAGDTATGPIYTTELLPTADSEFATKLYVDTEIAALGSGVTSFNTRTGAVVLNSLDLTAAGGALLASPTFTGVPLAPTAAPGTATTQLATTAFVGAAITAIPAGVASFNTRTGVVALTAGDVSGVGGALLVGGANAAFTNQISVTNATTATMSVNSTGTNPPGVLFNTTSTGTNAGLIQASRNGQTRWQIFIGSTGAESGGNAGSDLAIVRCADNGAGIDVPLNISRQSGTTATTSLAVTGTGIAFSVTNGAGQFNGAANLVGGGALAGTFTGTPTFSQNITFGNNITVNGPAITVTPGAGVANVTLNGGGGAARGIIVQSSGTTIWTYGGMNTSDWGINRFVGGTATDFPIQVSGSTGVVTLGTVTHTGVATFSVQFNANTTIPCVIGTGAGSASLTINGGGGSALRGITLQGGGTTSWYQGASNTSDWLLTRYVAGTLTDSPITVRTASGEVDLGLGNADIIVGKQSGKALTETTGFLAIPWCSGAPTGVPTNSAKGICLVYDTLDHKLWAYEGGTWKGVTFA